MSSKRWSESKFGGLIHGKKQKDQIASSNRGQEEKMEAVLWINQTLIDAGHSRYAINDITRDLSDGIVLVRLLESMTGDSVPHHSPPPLSRSQKLNNVQTVLSFIGRRGVSTTGINSEDVYKGNLKSILNLCHRVRQGIAIKKDSPAPAFKKDPLLSWAEGILHCEIMDYSEFRDGRYLCDIMNALQSGIVSPNMLLSNPSPQKCLTSALQIAERQFGVSIGRFDVMQVVKGENDAVLQVFLQQLRNVKPHNNVSTAFKRMEQFSTNESSQVDQSEQQPWYTRYENFETRDYKKPAAPPRSTEDTASYIEGPPPTLSNQREPRGSQQQKLRVSHSTDYLFSNSSGYQSSPFYGGSSEFKHADRRSNKKPRQRPVSVDESLPVSETNRAFHRQQPDTQTHRFPQGYPHPGPQGYSLPRHSDRVGGGEGGGGRGVEQSLSSRHPLSTSNTTVEYSYSNDIPMPVTIYRTSSRSSIHSTSSRSSADDQHITLAHLSNQQPSIPPHMIPPEYQTERSLRDMYRKNNGGNGSWSARSTSMDRLPQSSDDVDKCLVELIELMAEEKNVLTRRLLKAVAREKRKRHQLEMRFEAHVRTSQNTIQRYEACLVQLGKEIAKLSTELSNMKEHTSSDEKDLPTHVEQASQMTKPSNTVQTSAPNESSGIQEKGKRSIFSRKGKQSQT